MSRDHDSYRNRVQDIRAEARSLIERLRAERLAKSRFAAKPAAVAAPPAPTKADIEAWTGGAPLAALPAAPAAKAAPKAATRKAVAKPVVSKSVAAKPVVAMPVAVPADVAKAARPKPAKQKPAMASALDEKKPATAPVVVESPALKPVVAKAGLPARPKRKPAKAVEAPRLDPEIEPIGDLEELPRMQPAEIPQSDAAVPARGAPVAKSRARAAKTVPPRVAPSVSLLPGIGPGLIWRLEQSGYRTLDDVAGARVEELRARLGAVGNLVKLDRWIAFAQENIAEPQAATAAKDEKAA
jgi:Meckel syndrome type 1 protein